MGRDHLHRDHPRLSSCRDAPACRRLIRAGVGPRHGQTRPGAGSGNQWCRTRRQLSRTRAGPSSSLQPACNLGPKLTAPHSQRQVRCRPHEQGTEPTRTRPGRSAWPFWHRSGGRTIHCPDVDLTNSPTAAIPSCRPSPYQPHKCNSQSERENAKIVQSRWRGPDPYVREPLPPLAIAVSMWS